MFQIKLKNHPYTTTINSTISNNFRHILNLMKTRGVPITGFQESADTMPIRTFKSSQNKRITFPFQ